MRDGNFQLSRQFEHRTSQLGDNSHESWPHTVDLFLEPRQSISSEPTSDFNPFFVDQTSTVGCHTHLCAHPTLPIFPEKVVDQYETNTMTDRGDMGSEHIRKSFSSPPNWGTPPASAIPNMLARNHPLNKQLRAQARSQRIFPTPELSKKAPPEEENNNGFQENDEDTRLRNLSTEAELLNWSFELHRNGYRPSSPSLSSIPRLRNQQDPILEQLPTNESASLSR